MKKIFLISVVILILVSCTNKQSNKKNVVVDTNVESVIEEESPKNEFAVKEKSEIFKSPNSKEKVLNRKATNALGETTYCEISRECVVKILDAKDEWVKIQVIEPDWLSSSHIGWVKKSCIAMDDKSDQTSIQEDKDYEIMHKDIQGTVTNYYIKNITCKLNESDLYDFAKAIQKQVGGQCNIYIYSSDEVKDLMTKYPLQGEEYLKVADAFVYSLYFDGTYSFYPFQDVLYKQFGGKNWKKEPIK